jgi:hypothetical protein
MANRYSVYFAILSDVLITIMLPFVDEIEGFRRIPAWVRVGPLIILLFHDFPFLFTTNFFSGAFWPETIPTMITVA